MTFQTRRPVALLKWSAVARKNGPGRRGGHVEVLSSCSRKDQPHADPGKVRLGSVANKGNKSGGGGGTLGRTRPVWSSPVELYRARLPDARRGARRSKSPSASGQESPWQDLSGCSQLCCAPQMAQHARRGHGWVPDLRNTLARASRPSLVARCFGVQKEHPSELGVGKGPFSYRNRAYPRGFHFILNSCAWTPSQWAVASPAPSRVDVFSPQFPLGPAAENRRRGGGGKRNCSKLFLFPRQGGRGSLLRAQRHPKRLATSPGIPPKKKDFLSCV